MTKDRFEFVHHSPREAVNRTPNCTRGGIMYCDRKSRNEARKMDPKSVLTDDLVRKLNPKGKLNWKYGGFVNINSVLS